MTSKRTVERSTKTDRRRNRNAARTVIGRRRLLRATGGLAVTGLLAGCSGDGNQNGGDGDAGDSDPSLDEWLSGTDNYDSVTEMTGKKAVTVEVGPAENEYVFEPAAIRIDPGTTVTWKWVGSGHHNVVARDGQFDSGSPEERATFEHAFDSAGTALYYCQPHKSMGMKGGVVVGDEGTNGGN